jgi:hypothetical protein
MIKTIKSEIAIGIILTASVIVGGLAWFTGKNISENSKIESERNSQALISMANQKRNAKILFATNGQKDAYKIKRGDKWIVLIDGKESAAYDYVSAPAFSMDGTQFAFGASLDGQILLVVNNNPQPINYDSIAAIVFSPDGRAIAYVAAKDEKYMVVVNEKEGKTYQDIGLLQTTTGSTFIVFSNDGENIAYKVIEDQKVFVVVNEQEGKRYDEITNFSFTGDGGQFSYEAQNGDQQVIVVNNQEIRDNDADNSATSQSGGNTQSGADNSNNRGNSQSNEGKDVHLDQNKLRRALCESVSKCNF